MTILPLHAIYLLAVLATLRFQPQSPIPAAFVMLAGLPILAFSVWLEVLATKRTRVAWIASCAAVLLGSSLALVPGFSLCHPLTAFLRCAALLGACWVAALGWARGWHTLGVRPALVVLLWILPWAVLFGSPFFGVSWVTAWFADLSPNDVAGGIVSLHPLSAFCDALGGVDAFREQHLYERAEIGAHYAYHLPDVFTHVLGFTSIAAVGWALGFLRRPSRETPAKGSAFPRTAASPTEHSLRSPHKEALRDDRQT